MTERQKTLIDFFLRTPPTRRTATLWAGSRLLAPAIIATIPRWMRRLGGFDQWRLTDAVIGPLQPPVPAPVVATRRLSCEEEKFGR